MVDVGRTRTAWDKKLIERVLANAELFRGTSPAATAILAARSWSIEARRKQRIVAKGGRLPGMFVVAYGTVKIALCQGARRERVVQLAQAGQTFAEGAALLGRAAAFEATALMPCRLVVVPAAAVLSLIDGDPRAARQMVLALARRNLDLLEDIESSSTRRSAQRLAAYLGSLVGPARDANGDALKVRLPATKTLIASRIGVKKETLSRLLRALSRDGLIDVDGSEITLLDPRRLEQVTLQP
jgi:CRP/FNR family transcriptional regulator, dissimilatory nitrate respiration regulator